MIVKTSSDEDSIVLDCFCASGTTLKLAQLNCRKWVGVDKSKLAIEATKNKLAAITGDLFISSPVYEFMEFEKGKQYKSPHPISIPSALHSGRRSDLITRSV